MVARTPQILKWSEESFVGTYQLSRFLRQLAASNTLFCHALVKSYSPLGDRCELLAMVALHTKVKETAAR